MSRRALIIAIENYASLKESLSGKLDGTHAGTQRFYQWLINTKGVATADIFFCTDDASAITGRRGVKREQIKQAIIDLHTAGADDTAELYVYFSGHGFFYTDTGGRATANVLIAADYVERSQSGDKCINVDELQRELRLTMGPGDHFYFIDACRNEVSSIDVNVASLGLRLKKSVLGDPTVYTIYSTQRGRAAAAGSDFSERLVAGLGGHGRAKVWPHTNPHGRMVVLFDSLTSYLKGQLPAQQVDGDKSGLGDGVLLEIVPPPQYACTIAVKNAAPQDAFTLIVQNAQGQTIRGPERFVGPNHVFTEVAQDYYLTVRHPSHAVAPIEQPPADLYENCLVHFQKQSAGSPLTQSPIPPTTIRLSAALGTRLHLRRLVDGTVVEVPIGKEEEVAPGRYMAKWIDSSGVTLMHDELTVQAGAQFEYDPGRLVDRPVLASILSHLPSNARSADERTAVLSEGLGPLADPDLSIWLALLGASRIVGPDTFSKLGGFQLQTFAAVMAGEAPVYVLAGFDLPTDLHVALSNLPTNNSQQPVWQTAAPVNGIPGLLEAFFPGGPGPKCLSVQVPNQASLTLATYGLPNRATFITVSADPDRVIRFHQFLLPIHHLQGHLDPTVVQRMNYNPLRLVKFIAEAQRRFSLHKQVEPPAGHDLEIWQGFLDDKWLDPIMAIIASYELIRRADLQHLPIVVTNLRRYFTGLPDTEAIAKLSHQQWNQPIAPPMLIDGVMTFDDREFLQYPAARLNYRGPWTCWRGVI